MIKAGGIMLSDMKVHYKATVIKSGIVMTQKYTHRSREHNREHRNKPTFMWSVNLWQKMHKYKMGKEQSLQ